LSPSDVSVDHGPRPGLINLSSFRTLGLFGVPVALVLLTPELPVLAALVIAAYVALLGVLGGLSRLAKSAAIYVVASTVYLSVALVASEPTSDYGVQKVSFLVFAVFPFSLIVSSLVRKPEDVRPIATGAFALGVVVACGTSFTMNRDLLGAERYQWLGNLCAFAAAIAIQGWVVRSKLINGAALVVALIGIAIAAAKQSLVLVAAGWIVTLLVRLNSGRRALGYILFTMVAAGTLATQVDRIASLPLAANMVQRLGGLTTSTGGFTLLQRGLLWKKAWNCYAANPVTGIGIGHYADFPGYTAEAPGDTHWYPHNVVLETLCEQGTIGFSILFIPLMVAGAMIFRRGSKTGGEPYLAALILAVLATTAAGLSGDMMSRPLWVYGILLIRLVALRGSAKSDTRADHTP